MVLKKGSVYIMKKQSVSITKEKIIFMPSIALRLQDFGFPIIRKEVNRKNPRYEVYFFEDTQDFEKALTVIMEERKK